MCLEIIAAIAPDAQGRISSSRLSHLTGLRVSSRRFNGAPALHFAVGKRCACGSGDCSCDLLAENTKSGSVICSLAPNYLPALSEAVNALGRECKRFFFIAHWLSSERPRQITRISVAALRKLVAENKICNNVLYVVGYSRA